MNQIREIIGDFLYPLSPSITDATMIEDSHNLTELLQLVYPISMMLNDLPDKHHMNVGIMIDERGIEYNAAYLACIMANVTMTIIPPIDNKIELISYLSRANVNVLLVSTSNPFDEEYYDNSVMYPFSQYYGISLVYDITGNKFLFYRKRLKQLVMKYSEIDVPKYIADYQWGELQDMRSKNRAKIIMPSSATTHPDSELFYVPYKRLDLVINGMLDFVGAVSHIQTTWLIQAPKWRHHMLTILMPLLANIDVNTMYDPEEYYDVAMFDVSTIKEIIDMNYYYHHASKFKRTIFPNCLLNWLGKRRLKRKLKNINTVVILNADIPEYYIQLLSHVVSHVVTTYGCAECNQLGGYTIDKPYEPAMIEHILPTITLTGSPEIDVKRPVTVSGKGIAKPLFNKKKSIVDTDDIIYFNEDGKLVFVSRTIDLWEDQITGLPLLLRNIANGFKTLPYVEEANIVIENNDMLLLIKPALKYSSLAGFTLETIDQMLEYALEEYNKESDGDIISRVIVYPTMIKSLSKEAARWPYDKKLKRKLLGLY